MEENNSQEQLLKELEKSKAAYQELEQTSPY